jgi:hypothetical protein
MGKVVSKLLGGSGKVPEVSDKASNSVKSDASDATKLRASLYATEGGAAGQELNPSDVEKRRNTLLGN